MWLVSPATVIGQGSVRGFAGGLNTRRRAPGPSQAGPLDPLPCSGAAMSSRRRSPSTSAHLMRCRVGSAEMGNTSHAGVVPGAFCFTHTRVPVFCPVQPAPSAMSRRPSPSISCGASVTLSAVVWPAPNMTVFSQVGALNQTSSVPLMARISVRLSPSTSPGTTAYPTPKSVAISCARKRRAGLLRSGCCCTAVTGDSVTAADREDQGEELRSARMRLHGAAV